MHLKIEINIILLIIIRINHLTGPSKVNSWRCGTVRDTDDKQITFLATGSIIKENGLHLASLDVEFTRCGITISTATISLDIQKICPVSPESYTSCVLPISCMLVGLMILALQLNQGCFLGPGLHHCSATGIEGYVHL